MSRLLQVLASFALAALGIAVIVIARNGMLAQTRAWEEANRTLTPTEAAWGRFGHTFGAYWYLPAAVWLLACLALAFRPLSSVDREREFPMDDARRHRD